MPPDEGRERKVKTGAAGKIAAALTAGLLYFCFVRMTGKGLPCFFHLVTGLKCPGCGITTMVMAVSRGDLREAYRANPFLFLTSPFVLGETLYCLLRAYRGKKNPKANEILLLIYVVLLLGWGVLRIVRGL